jgi:hypothetical protein
VWIEKDCTRCEWSAQGMPLSRIFAAATTNSASMLTQGIDFRPSSPNSPLRSEYGLYAGKYVCLLLCNRPTSVNRGNIKPRELQDAREPQCRRSVIKGM